ncbi:hypothetical protein [Pigmentiphaga litoralis]|uniref:hypothetical protein n=1 Tax=Pigmentiphaga litoralis TaxID=516702 RepID=UPI003B439D8D
MRGTSKAFPYQAATGFHYQVMLNLEHHPENGQYSGLAQAYEGNPNNSAYVGNAVPLHLFDAASLDDAFEKALRHVGSQLDEGLLTTPGVLGRRSPLTDAHGLGSDATVGTPPHAQPGAVTGAAAGATHQSASTGGSDPAYGREPTPTGGRSDNARPATQISPAADRPA